MILNLRELNKFITPHYFKMDTFEMALKLVKQDCYFGSIDLRHAYYSVSIAKEDQKYLRFIWKEFFFSIPAYRMVLHLLLDYLQNS